MEPFSSSATSKRKICQPQINHVSSIIRCTKWAACLLGVFGPERRHADHLKGSEENAYLCFFLFDIHVK